MILKIERYSEEQRWWIWDDIRKISISQPRFHSGAPEIGTDTDAIILDCRTKCKCKCTQSGERCDDCIRYFILICRLNNGEEYSIAFDTVAYLLNDNGKTIEKILANYDN